MNSKLEYSRTIIPKIKMKMGNRAEKEDPKVTEEKSIIEKIISSISVSVAPVVAGLFVEGAAVGIPVGLALALSTSSLVLAVAGLSF